MKSILFMTLALIQMSGILPLFAQGNSSPKPPVTQPTPPVTQPTPPVTQPTPPVTQPTPPVTEPTPPVTQPTPPVTQPAPPVTQPAQPVIDPETQKKIDEARQKILDEKLRKDAETKREQEDAQRRASEQENNFFNILRKKSALWVGVNSGLGLAMNQIHGTGYEFGGFVDYRLFDHYGLRLGAATGVWPTKDFKFKSGDYTLPQAQGGSIGFLRLSSTLQYTLPRFSPLDLNIGAGIAYYQLSGGNFSLGPTMAPQVNVSAFYNFWNAFEAGLILELLAAGTSQITRSGAPFDLDARESLTSFGISGAIRYRFF